MSIPAPNSSLTQIQSKVRLITGRPDLTQLSDNDLNQYIQTFVVYDFPEILRLLNLKETYTFNTEANIDSYDFNRNRYISVRPPLYIDGYQSFWSQSREQFYRVWPKISFQLNAGNGDNSSPQTFNVSAVPILRGSRRFSPSGVAGPTIDSDITVSLLDQDASGNFTSFATYIDDGNGNLIDSSYANTFTTAAPATFGTVNYLTGVFSLNGPIPTTRNVRISTVPYTAGRPTSCLFFDDKFVLRPVPDAGYKVSIEAFKSPIEYFAATQEPELNEWWQFIAMGAALKVFEDQAELEEYAKFYPLFEKYKILAQRRTIVQQTNQRTSSIYEDQTSFTLYQNFFSRF